MRSYCPLGGLLAGMAVRRLGPPPLRRTRRRDHEDARTAQTPPEPTTAAQGDAEGAGDAA